MMETSFVMNDDGSYEIHRQKMTAVCRYCKWRCDDKEELKQHLKTETHINNKNQYPERRTDDSILATLVPRSMIRRNLVKMYEKSKDQQFKCVNVDRHTNYGTNQGMKKQKSIKNLSFHIN